MKKKNWLIGSLICFIGALFLVGTAVAAPPEVVCVPWFPGNLAVPHDTWSGKEITLKGTAHDPDGDALASYEWDFGDGSIPVSGAVTNPYVIEAKHTYIGDIGDKFVAKLTVTDVNGESGSDDYLIEIRDGSVRSVKINVAIDEGLWYLHKTQNRGTYDDGEPYGYWSGSWPVSYTAGATEAFEIHGHLPDGNAAEDPYVDTVQRGLNYLFNQFYTHAIGEDPKYCPLGDPDINANGIGLGCYTDYRHSMYESGITLMTIASSKCPNRVAQTGSANVVGRAYKDIVQDMVEYLAYGQSDPYTGVYEGGWRYYANYGISDNSVSQWPAIGMEAAELNFGNFGVTVPAFVKPELVKWINYSQGGDGGFGYTAPGSWENVAKTGAGCAMMAFCDISADDPRYQKALDFLDVHWFDTAWRYTNFGDYYSMYAVMKGMRLQEPDVEWIGAHDWYAEYADYIVNDQLSDGHWNDHSWLSRYVTPFLSTAWALLTLQETVVMPGPVADAGPDVANHPPLIEVKFDASGSYHNDPTKEIVQYCWDFDASDGMDWENPDYCSAEPKVTHAFPAVYKADGTIDWDLTTKDYTVTLRVIDNNVPPKYDTDECIVHITPPPWPPVADAGGPYTAGKCETITLDGSGSSDPNGQFYPDPDYPWHGYIVSWEWDLDNDGLYDDATGETVEWSSCEKGLYVIGLKVTNNFGDSDTEDTVINVVNRPPVADANGPYSCGGGKAIVFDGSGSYDPDPGETETLQYRWDFESDGVYDTDWSTDPTYTYTYPVCKEYTVTLQVKDVDGACGTDTAQVIPNRPPNVDKAVPSIDCLWPPNHKFVDITIEGVTDPDGDVVTITVTGITSDEPTASIEGAGGAKHAPDAYGVGTATASLRAERSGKGNGRVYEITFVASDGKGGEAEGSVTVCVPHDRRKDTCLCVDDGQNYDATQIN